MFGRKKNKALPAPVEDKSKDDELINKTGNGYFSTDTFFRIGNPKSWLEKNAIQVVPKMPSKVVNVATDGVEEAKGFAMDGGSLKAAFTLSNQLPDSIFCWYGAQSFIGYQACAILAQNWLVNKACSQSPKDAARKGWELTTNDGQTLTPEQRATIRKLDKKYKVKKNLVEYGRHNRIFGIRIMIFNVESTDQQYYQKPFNIDGVKKGSYKGMIQVDPYWITPELSMEASGNPGSPEFYEPTYWRISGKRYHRSHLVIARYDEVPDVLKPTYTYGGLSLTQLIYERVYAAERTANEGPQLAMTKRTTGLYVDMEAAIANEQEFTEKMQEWAAIRDNYGVKVLGENEKMEQFDTTLTDFDVTVMTQYQLVSAIARTPATKLLGTSPKGFNATGEYEEDSYHEELESIQSDEYEPVLERHYELLLKSEGINAEVEINWNSLKVLSEKEIAELNESKSRTDLNLVNAGSIDGYDSRKRISEDDDSGYNDIEIDGVPEEENESEVEENEIDLNEAEKQQAKANDQQDWIFAMDAIRNGYVSVKPRSRDAAKYFAAAAKAGIDDLIEPDKLHVTLMYSSEDIPEPSYAYQPLIAKPTGEIRVMGEGEYRAIVVMLDSPDLHQRHNEIKLVGGVPRHEAYLPHISLKYAPTEADIARIGQIEIPDEPIILENEQWSSAKD